MTDNVATNNFGCREYTYPTAAGVARFIVDERVDVTDRTLALYLLSTDSTSFVRKALDIE
jgi:hypothetical protein